MHREGLQQWCRLLEVSRVQILGPLSRAMVGVAGQRLDEPGPVHADRAMDSPRLDRDADLGEGSGPGVHVQVVGVDQGAVDVEQHRGLISHRPGMPAVGFV